MDWNKLQKIRGIQGNSDYGITVSVYENYAAVGSYKENVDGGADRGAVYVYKFNGIEWIFDKTMTDACYGSGKKRSGFLIFKVFFHPCTSIQ